MDLSNMSVGDLRNLQEQIKQEMKQREHQEDDVGRLCILNGVANAECRNKQGCRAQRCP